MFFHIVLERNKQLHPPPLRSRPPREADLQAHERRGGHLQVLFYSKFTNNDKACGRHGFVVAITGIENVGKGLIRDGTGFVTFPVKYQCVVFRPFKGEILEAVVTMVNKLIQDDMEFQSGDMPNYTTSDGSVKIQKESEVRLKIIGTRVDATEIFCIGTIKDDFLGVISDPGATS
ncbi:hypothetical protein CsSME_00041038 [Camellia sinensis var. sinensis]